jgi:adenylate cyclase
MAQPSFEELSPSYFKHQTDRVIRTLEQIVSRPSVNDGRIVPAAHDIAIHDGRRINATVMFVDICRFSQRPSSTSSEQEIVLKTLALFFSEMIRISEDFGGVVEKNTGDGLMAYFADSDPSGVNSQTRALTAALTMFSAVARLINPILANSGLREVQFRICMDYGLLTIAKLGASRRFSSIVAIGTPANLASKMLAIAGADTILLGDRMLSGVPEQWRRDYCRVAPLSSGWFYTRTGKPYPFWPYAGRWVDK